MKRLGLISPYYDQIDERLVLILNNQDCRYSAEALDTYQRTNIGKAIRPSVTTAKLLKKTVPALTSSENLETFLPGIVQPEVQEIVSIYKAIYKEDPRSLPQESPTLLKFLNILNRGGVKRTNAALELMEQTESIRTLLRRVIGDLILIQRGDLELTLERERFRRYLIKTANFTAGDRLTENIYHIEELSKTDMEDKANVVNLLDYQKESIG